MVVAELVVVAAAEASPAVRREGRGSGMVRGNATAEGFAEDAVEPGTCGLEPTKLTKTEENGREGEAFPLHLITLR